MFEIKANKSHLQHQGQTQEIWRFGPNGPNWSATTRNLQGSAYLVSMLSVMKCKKSHLIFLKVEITEPRRAEFFHKRLCFVT